jgi:hypothetical protein
MRILRLESAAKPLAAGNTAIPGTNGFRTEIMLRANAAALALGISALAGCGHSEYALRPVPRIVADNVGQPVSRLQDAFGEPRKIDQTSTKWVYVWFLPEKPPGAPAGFHGCEMEVTVDARTQHVLGYSLSNIGWSNCREVERRIRVAER